MPLDAGPVQIIRADSSLWEMADGYPPFGSLRDGEVLPDISGAILAVVGFGAGWVEHFGDRSFQQAEYLLDPLAYRASRTWEQRELTMAYRIVHGDEPFATHARSGQGMPWRCSSAAFLAAAVQRIDSLDVAAVRREFSIAEMARLGVYKVHPEDDDERAFDRVLTRLYEFGEYCRGVVAKNLDLIITLW